MVNTHNRARSSAEERERERESERDCEVFGPKQQNKRKKIVTTRNALPLQPTIHQATTLKKKKKKYKEAYKETNNRRGENGMGRRNSCHPDINKRSRLLPLLLLDTQWIGGSYFLFLLSYFHIRIEKKKQGRCEM